MDKPLAAAYPFQAYRGRLARGCIALFFNIPLARYACIANVNTIITRLSIRPPVGPDQSQQGVISFVSR